MTQIDRIHIAYTLTFSTPFHCGTGLRVGLIDRTVVRDHEGYLYIPGSTIKGILREQCERLACLFQDDADEKKILQALTNPHNERMALLGRRRPPSMVTRIFGSQFIPGQLFFDDARQTDTQKRPYESGRQGASKEEAAQRKKAYQGLQTDIATQVRIDRPSRTAVGGALYTSEFGIRDQTFAGTITGWIECLPMTNLNEQPTYSLLLLLLSLHLLERIGSNKSAGKGQCTCTITELRTGKTTPIQEEVWQSWFDHLENLSYYALEDGLQKEDM